jgi:hypothetical protein
MERWSIARVMAETGKTEAYVRRSLRRTLDVLRTELAEEVHTFERLRDCGGLDMLAATILGGHLSMDPPYPFLVRREQRGKGRPVRKRVLVHQ